MENQPPRVEFLSQTTSRSAEMWDATGDQAVIVEAVELEALWSQQACS